MIFWFLKVSFLSFLFIFLIDHLFNYFKNNLTIPKTKDLVKMLDKYGWQSLLIIDDQEKAKGLAKFTKRLENRDVLSVNGIILVVSFHSLEDLLRNFYHYCYGFLLSSLQLVMRDM